MDSRLDQIERIQKGLQRKLQDLFVQKRIIKTRGGLPRIVVGDSESTSNLSPDESSDNYADDNVDNSSALEADYYRKW